MNGIYMPAYTKELFDNASESLQRQGYVWVGINKNPSFDSARKWFHGRSQMYLHAYYNNINGKCEIRATTKTVEKSYPGFSMVEFEGRICCNG